jgi:hypothetical protein
MKSGNTPGAAAPYQEDSTNLIYNWLFCDNITLFRNNIRKPYSYPWDILLNDKTDIAGLQKITADATIESRAKILAYNQLAKNNYFSEKKELLAVIVEVGLDEGPDTLAAFKDGTARYINQTGKMIIWESPESSSDKLIKELFANSAPIISQIGPWHAARRPQPASGMARISFLVSDGLYFGEAPMNALFNDALAKPALLSATALMQFLTDKVLGPVAN